MYRLCIDKCIDYPIYILDKYLIYTTAYLPI